MNLVTKVSRVERLGGSYHADRIAAQIGYAARLSSVNGGRFDTTIEVAVDFILEAVDSTGGVITAHTAKAAEELLEPISQAAKSLKIHAVSHAHLDMDWLWGHSETSVITIETFRTMLQLMREYPDFTFSQSQASAYKIVEDYSPEMLPEIRARIAEGRWEVTASTWTETDKNMPSGESLSRHILYTKRYMNELFGVKYDDMAIDFEPDTFGHNLSVPEIMTRGGVKYYYHCRGYDKQYIYRWRSKSGAEVLVYREPKWYNADISWKCFNDLPIFCSDYGVNIALKVYGVGDHGGGPTRRDIEHLIDMQSWTVAPTVVFSTYHKFFAELEAFRDKIAVVDEELNFVFTGCYTSQSRIKMANRIAEARAYESEVLSTAACLLGGPDYGRLFGRAWENVLYNHFHDIIPGSGVTETRENAMGNFQRAMSHIFANSSNALRFIADRIDTSPAAALYGAPSGGKPFDIKESNAEGAGVGYAVADNTGVIYSYQLPQTERGVGDARIFHIVNPTQYHRKEVTPVTVWDWQHVPHLAVWRDAAGKETRSQQLDRGGYWGHDRATFAVEVDVPPYSYKTYTLTEREQDKYNFRSTSDPRRVYSKDDDIVLENAHVYAKFDRRTMKLISYVDKMTGSEMISAPSAYYRYIVEDHRSNAWNVGAYMKVVDLNAEYNVRLGDEHRGGLVNSFNYEIEFLSSRLKTTVSLKEDSRTLEFDAEIDWREMSDDRKTPQIGFYVPFGYKADKYRYDIPFGTLDRDGARDDRPAQSFVCALPNVAYHASGHPALALINNTRYGYRCHDNSIYLHLLHSTASPDAHPECDNHTVRIGLYLAPDTENTVLFAEASAFVHQLSVVSNRPHKSGDERERLPYSHGTLLKVDGNTVVSAIKTPEDADLKGKGYLIIRLYDISGKKEKITLEFPAQVKDAVTVDTVEAERENSAVTHLKHSENKVVFTLDAYASATLRIKL